MPIRIRRAGAADAAAAADLYLRARRAAAPAIPPSVYDDADVHRWIREEMVARGHVWLAVDGDGALAGVLAVTPGWVEQLYVEPGRTGRGIGSELLAFAKGRESTGELQLWAFETNTGARRFYERHGFVAVEHTDGSGNVEREPDVRYVWRAAASG